MLKYYFVEKLDTPNANKRIYPTKVIEDNLARLKEVQLARGWMGELGARHDSIIHLNTVSHLIVDAKIENGNLMIAIEPLNTPCGRLLKEMISKDEITFRLSGIGGGQWDENNNFVFDDGYKLITIDAHKKN